MNGGSLRKENGVVRVCMLEVGSGGSCGVSASCPCLATTFESVSVPWVLWVSSLVYSLGAEHVGATQSSYRPRCTSIRT